MKHIKKLFVTQLTIAGKKFTIAAVKDTKEGRVKAGMTVLHLDDTDDPVKAEAVAMKRANKVPFYVTDYGTMKVKDEGIMNYLRREVIETFFEVVHETLLGGLKAEGYFGLPEKVRKAIVAKKENDA